jgi:hypothetical protein
LAPRKTALVLASFVAGIAGIAGIAVIAVIGAAGFDTASA